MTDSALQSGLIVTNHGRHFWVEDTAGKRRRCSSRSKKSQGVVGDRVLWLPSADEGTIERIEPRRNLLYRQDEWRTKAFAANLDQVLILIAAEPEFSGHQLSRALIAAQEQHITPMIVLNKRDMDEPFARAWNRLAPYRAMGYDLLGSSLTPCEDSDRQQLMQRLRGRTTLILGPSGTGKSTLINVLIPTAQAQTGEVSQALKSGKHTTTHTTWYWVDAERHTAVLDSPGFQEFGLHHIDPAQLAAYMPDLKPHVAECKFYNCTHLHEPGCGVRAAVASDTLPNPISAERYKIYCDLYAELAQARRY